MPTVVPQRAFEGDLLFMRSLMSITPVGENPTTKSYFWRRILIDVRVKATYDSYCLNRYRICLGTLFAIFFYLLWEFETSTLLTIGDWWLLIY